jgi:hypothetical protein
VRRAVMAAPSLTLAQDRRACGASACAAQPGAGSFGDGAGDSAGDGAVGDDMGDQPVQAHRYPLSGQWHCGAHHVNWRDSRVTFVVGEVVCFTGFFAGQALISGMPPTRRSVLERRDA